MSSGSPAAAADESRVLRVTRRISRRNISPPQIPMQGPDDPEAIHVSPVMRYPWARITVNTPNNMDWIITGAACVCA